MMKIQWLMAVLVYVAITFEPVVSIECYSCTGTPTKEKGGTCRENIGADTVKKTCDGPCELKVQKKESIGMGTWYDRQCRKNCKAEDETKGGIQYITQCCSTSLCNDVAPGVTTTTTTTTTTTPMPTGTGTATDSTDSTQSTNNPTTAAATTTSEPDGDLCYECSWFFVGGLCNDEEKLNDPSISKVTCDLATTGSCAKMSSKIDWLGYEYSVSRGCSTSCKGKEEVIESGLTTEIYCCVGDLCNAATVNIPTRALALLSMIVAAFIRVL